MSRPWRITGFVVEGAMLNPGGKRGLSAGLLRKCSTIACRFTGVAPTFVQGNPQYSNPAITSTSWMPQSQRLVK